MSIEQQRELTFGEKAVGLTFNPGGMPEVARIKILAAALLDEIKLVSLNFPQASVGFQSEQEDFFKEAIRRIQEGQMWAVKAATWQY